MTVPWPSPVQRRALQRMTRMQDVAEIRVPGLRLWVRRRPSYCDRGEWEVHADPRDQPPIRVSIDEADHFPRVYFSLDAMLNEVRAFLEARDRWDEDDPPDWDFPSLDEMMSR